MTNEIRTANTHFQPVSHVKIQASKTTENNTHGIENTKQNGELVLSICLTKRKNINYFDHVF